MYVVVPCSQNFSPTLPPTLVGELFIHEFFNDYNEDMVTFIALVKIYSIKHFCTTSIHVAKIVHQNFSYTVYIDLILGAVTSFL